MRSTVLLCLAALLSACASSARPVASAPRPPPNWRSLATETDRLRLRDWRETFVRAVTAAGRAGHGAAVSREGALLEPDAALGGGPIPNGLYRCRVIKLGAKSQGMLNFVSYPAFTCRITPDGALQRFVKVTGSQRHVGRIYPGDAMRQVFLGTLVLGDERAALPYGQDQTRNVAGFVERIGPARWRLMIPNPHFESQLDVLELVPTSEGMR